MVWNMAFMTFHHIGNVIIPTDELIFFRGVGQPPTRLNGTKTYWLMIGGLYGHFIGIPSIKIWGF